MCVELPDLVSLGRAYVRASHRVGISDGVGIFYSVGNSDSVEAFGSAEASDSVRDVAGAKWHKPRLFPSSRASAIDAANYYF